MHSRVIMSRNGRPRRSLPWLVILLTHLATTAAAHPYLGHVAPPPLRMREPESLPAEIPVTEIIATEPPALAESESQPPAVDPAPVPAAVETPPSEAAQPAPARPAATPPPPILQDPLRERVQLEDFLPFFTPPSAAQPASRATYRRE